ncbi:MAG TPA: EAL domain-containing protein [Methylophilaceae bacterium]|jgi:diguanylate cyclase (GGDEF)-like protein/PAS domain S-box-containing protein
MAQDALPPMPDNNLQRDEDLRLFRGIFESSGEGIMVTDAQEVIVAVNRAFTSITQFSPNDVLGQTPRAIKSGRHDKIFFQELWTKLKQGGYWQGEIWNRRKDGSLMPTWSNISAVKNQKGQVTHYFSTFSDISDHMAAEERIRQLAFYDSLTGLPNRATFYSLIKQTLILARRDDISGGVMFIDLDRFKHINDTLGHGAGDELVRRVSARLKTCLRSSDVVARLGGDEFVVGLFDVKAQEDAAIVAQKMLATFATPFLIEGHEISISASIGISVYPNDGTEVDDLIKFADIAMYRAKERGRNTYLFYSNDMNVRSIEKLQMESNLRRAIDRKELLLHYQPQADIHTGEMTGAEVLIRWQHPERGMVSPGQFIPIAEETGLIVRIGRWVMDQAVAQNKAWQDKGLPIMKLAVNLAAQQFHPALTDEVSSILLEHDLSHEYLELEITESMVMHNPDQVVDMLKNMEKMGIKTSLDDFGTGYSSLSYLKRFPIYKLKVDQSFVRGLPGDEDDAAITRAIIGMGKSLGLRVIAEGVETREQLEFLRAEGCDEIQGYLFSKPIPPEEFEKLLDKDHRFPV